MIGAVLILRGRTRLGLDRLDGRVCVRVHRALLDLLVTGGLPGPDGRIAGLVG